MFFGFEFACRVMQKYFFSFCVQAQFIADIYKIHCILLWSKWPTTFNSLCWQWYKTETRLIRRLISTLCLAFCHRISRSCKWRTHVIQLELIRDCTYYSNTSFNRFPLALLNVFVERSCCSKIHIAKGNTTTLFKYWYFVLLCVVCRDLHLNDVTDVTVLSDTKFLVKRAVEAIIQNDQDAKETNYEFS